MTDFESLNTQLLSSNCIKSWFPNALLHGNKLRIGNLAGDKGSSLWVDLDTGAWKDHATGEYGSDLISLYAAINNLPQGEALKQLSQNACNINITPQPKRPTVTKTNKNQEYALQLWRESQPSKNSPVCTYLNGRGINSCIYNDIKYIPDHIHAPSEKTFPIMISAIRHGKNNDFIGVHRTYIKPDGSNKAPVSPTKMMLGNSAEGAVKITPAGEKLLIAEGIETALSCDFC